MVLIILFYSSELLLVNHPNSIAFSILSRSVGSTSIARISNGNRFVNLKCLSFYAPIAFYFLSYRSEIVPATRLNSGADMSLVNTTKTDATYGVYKSILFEISFNDIRGKLYVPDCVRRNVASIGGNDGGITAPEGIDENKLEMY